MESRKFKGHFVSRVGAGYGGDGSVYVMFTSAVVARKRMNAATWSSVWYLLSSFAVIHYTENWVYVATGSWIGAFTAISFMHWRSSRRCSA